MQHVQTHISQRLFNRLPKPLTGILTLFIIAAFAKYLGGLFPLIGSILFAIVFGIIIRNTIGLPTLVQPGVQFTVKKLLKLAVIFLGFSLSFSDILLIGKQSLLIILLAVILGISLTLLFGKILKMNHTLSLLIGVGASICGATAISAVKDVVKANENETAYAISIIVFFNLIAFFLYPFVGDLLDLDATAFGIWAGTAVHDTSTSIAVGYVYGDEAGKVATTVKLARTLFLLPLILLLPLLMNKNKQAVKKGSIQQVFPWFVILFMAATIFNSIIDFSSVITTTITDIAKFLIIMVMAAVGLQVNLKEFVKLGVKPLLTGLFASVTVAIASLLMILWML